jgi:hypothetical protein
MGREEVVCTQVVIFAAIIQLVNLIKGQHLSSSSYYLSY